MYPNPSTGKFTIKFYIKRPVTIELKITNSLGQEILREKLNKFKGSYNRQLDLEQYPTGNYHLQLRSEQGVINNKIIIE